MVGRVRVDEAGEDRLAVALDGPVEGAAVDDDAAQTRAVARVELRQGCDHDVRAQLQRADQGGGSQGVVHDQRDLVSVGDLRDGRDVQHVCLRV